MEIVIPSKLACAIHNHNRICENAFRRISEFIQAMAEIIGSLLEAVGSFLAKLYPPWILADFIIGGLSLLYVAATEGLLAF